MTQGSGTVLLIEDDEIVGKMTTRMLQYMGYTVLMADNPAQAIEICKQGDGAIDLVLSDVVMPGMSGKQAVDRIQALKPGVKVLYMSGYSVETVLEKGVDGARDNFIQKPFNMGLLNDKIKWALGSHVYANA